MEAFRGLLSMGGGLTYSHVLQLPEAIKNQHAFTFTWQRQRSLCTGQLLLLSRLFMSL
jgi:hypothetical protein